MFGYYFPKGFSFTPIVTAEPINSASCGKVKREPDGMSCVRCKDFFFLAEANQEDGSFKCYQCRENPYR